MVFASLVASNGMGLTTILESITHKIMTNIRVESINLHRISKLLVGLADSSLTLLKMKGCVAG